MIGAQVTPEEAWEIALDIAVCLIDGNNLDKVPSYAARLWWDGPGSAQKLLKTLEAIRDLKQEKDDFLSTHTIEEIERTYEHYLEISEALPDNADVTALVSFNPMRLKLTVISGGKPAE